MPATYENIATTTLGTAASVITFSSIAATYTDLRVVLVANSTTASASPYYRFNNISTTTYSTTYISGNGSAASSSRTTSQTYIMAGNSVSTSTTIPVFVTFDVLSYAGSTYKTSLYTTSNDLNGSGVVERGVGLWQGTNAINRIDVALSGSTMAAGTTATLYGIKNA
jgi:hypothetical protein